MYGSGPLVLIRLLGLNRSDRTDSMAIELHYSMIWTFACKAIERADSEKKNYVSGNESIVSLLIENDVLNNIFVHSSNFLH